MPDGVESSARLNCGQQKPLFECAVSGSSRRDKRNRLWIRRFNSVRRHAHPPSEECSTISHGGFLIVGGISPPVSSYSDVLAIRVDARGDVIWSKTYGGSDHDRAVAVARGASGGSLILGLTQSFGVRSSYGHFFYDLYAIRVDDLGNVSWSRTYEGSTFAMGAVATTDDGFMLLKGGASDSVGEPDLYVARVDARGEVLWSKTFGGPDKEVGVGLARTVEGDFLIVGGTRSLGAGDLDVYVVRIDGTGGCRETTRTIRVATPATSVRDLPPQIQNVTPAVMVPATRVTVPATASSSICKRLRESSCSLPAE